MLLLRSGLTLLTIFLSILAVEVTGDIPKVYNGYSAQPQEFPYQAQIQTLSGTHICGGIILTPDTVLTAAHCVAQGVAGGQVVGGQHIQTGSHSGNTDDGTEQVRTVTSCISHESFYSFSTGDDIAFLVLDRPFNFNSAVSNILIPTSNNNFADWATISGWGQDSSGSKPRILQKLNVTVYSKELCRRRHSNSRANTVICGGSWRAGLCYGDSGGPLTCAGKESRKLYACGINSFVTNGCRDTSDPYPSYFANVSNYHSWIVEKIRTSKSLKTCPSNYFLCDNFLCIPEEYQSDGEDDCGDGSDEINLSSCGGILHLRNNRPANVTYQDGGSYTKNEFCVWTLRAPKLGDVVITTNFDFGQQHAGLVLYQWTGSDLQSSRIVENVTSITLPTTLLYVAFSSDREASGPGFTLSFEVRESDVESERPERVSSHAFNTVQGNFTFPHERAGSSSDLTPRIVSVMVQGKVNGRDTKREALLTNLSSEPGSSGLSIYTFFGFGSKHSYSRRTGRYSGEFNAGLPPPGLITVNPTLYLFDESVYSSKSGFSISWNQLEQCE